MDTEIEQVLQTADVTMVCNIRDPPSDAEKAGLSR